MNGPPLLSHWLDWVVFGVAALVVGVTLFWAWRAAHPKLRPVYARAPRLVEVDQRQPVQVVAPRALPQLQDLEALKVRQVFTLAIVEFHGYCSYRKLCWALGPYNEAAPNELMITQREVRDLLRDYVYQGGVPKVISLEGSDYVLVQESTQRRRLVTMDRFEQLYMDYHDEEE